MNDYKIKKLYEEMENKLIDSMNRNLSNHLTEEDELGFEYSQWQAIKLKELKRYQKENQKIIQGYVNGLDMQVSEHLQKELKQGSLSAIKQYNKLTGNKLNPNKLMNKSFFKINDRKVNALIKSVNNDLKQANTGALRMINDEYRQIIHKSAFFVANGVQTEKQATDMAIEEISQKKATMQACDEVSKTFLAGGLNCIEYSNGRRVNISSYAAMAVRTASLRAHLMGEGDFRKSIGRTLVKVTTHGGACKICTKWQGKVLIDDVYSDGKSDGKHTLLSEAMKEGFLHPNCRHGITTYYPELEDVKYDEDKEQAMPKELKDKYNYYDRVGKQWKRKSKGYIDSDNKKEARQNYLTCEKKKEEIIKTNTTFYDATKEWLEEKEKEEGIIENQLFFIDKNNKRYDVNNKTVILDHTKSEEKIALWYAEQKKLNLNMLPRVLKPQSVKVGDFVERTSQISWEIKEPDGNTIGTTILNQFKGQKEKAHRFIIDMHLSEMDIDTAIKEIESILSNERYAWVEEVILLKDLKLQKVFRR